MAKKKQQKRRNKASVKMTIHEALKLLNYIHAIDPDCLDKLVRLRVCASYSLERTPGICTLTHPENYNAKVLGVVEIMNTLFRDDSSIIVPVFDAAGERLLTFIAVDKTSHKEDAVPQHKARR